MPTREQAEAVVNNPAFKAAFESLREEYVDSVLHGSSLPEDLHRSRLKYDALVAVELELIARLNDVTAEGQKWKD